MDYLGHFGLTSEPFSNAPLSRYYFASRQHTDALERLRYTAATMKGLAIVVGDIGLGKTTLARRILEALPEEEYEAAMLVMVHTGITANWLLKRIAIQVGVPKPADDKLTILSQLYKRLVAIYEAGKRAVVLIDEAQMLATRELMEEFRGLLNLEVPDQKLISFIFFGLPELEQNLRLDLPLAQRIALRYHLRPLCEEDTRAYIRHRLDLAGGAEREFFNEACLAEVVRFSKGVPRLINTLCDNLLLEMYFARSEVGGPDLVESIAANLGLGDEDLEVPIEPPPPEEVPAVEGGPGHDAIVAVLRDNEVTPAAADTALEPDAIAAQVANEPVRAFGLAGDEAPVVAVDQSDAEAPQVAGAKVSGVPPLVAAGSAEPLSGTMSVRADSEPQQLAGAEPPEAAVEQLGDGEVAAGEESPELVAVPAGELAALSAAERPGVAALPEPGPPEVPDAPETEPPEIAEAMDHGPPAVPLQVGEQATTVDIEDPLAFLAQQALPEEPLDQPSPWGGEVEDDVEEEVHEVSGDDLQIVEQEAPAQPSEPFDVDITVEEEESAAGSEPPVTEKPARRQIDLSEIDALLADLNLKSK